MIAGFFNNFSSIRMATCGLALASLLVYSGCGGGEEAESDANSSEPVAKAPANTDVTPTPEASPTPLPTLPTQAEGARPVKGQIAQNFALKKPTGEEVSLYELTAKGPAVILVMRGWVGYQCPNCSRQYGDFLAHASEYAAKGVNLVMVYPGPELELALHADEFIGDRTPPENFTVLLDPGMKFTSAYGLRWDEGANTAYPATIVVGADNEFLDVKISKDAGGRTDAAEILEKLNS